MSLTDQPRNVEDSEADEVYEWPLNVDWRAYHRLLRVRGERRLPRIVYLDGDLTLMTPSQPHEFLRSRIGNFIHEVVVGCEIPFLPTVSTTWKLRRLKVGVEGDLTYSFGNELDVRGKREIDLRTDPPPDLAVEVVYCHDVSRALEVYRRLGVPEVWVATEQTFSILTLNRTGRQRRYRQEDRSVGLPFLSADEIADWIARDAPDGEMRWTLDLRDWVRDTIVPRLDAGDEAR